MSFSRGPRSLSSSGLTRVEWMVLLAIVLAFAALAWIPVSHYLAESRLTHAVQNSATLATLPSLLSQYATDNDGVYPVGEGTPNVGTSEGIARNFLENNYIPDARIFAVGSTPKYGGTAQDYSDLAPSNISWDFTAGATPSTGITSAAPDLLPVVFTTGQTVNYPKTPGTGLNLPLTAPGPFGLAGIVVAYKNKSAVFIRATLDGTPICPGFIPTSFQDTGTYTQIKP